MNKLIQYKSTPYKLKSSVASFLPFVQPYQYNLSVSHSHKLVWFRVAKVGTRTIFETLDRSGVEIDKSHPRFTRYPNKSFDTYTKAAFVRNPWDRLVSAWQNKVVDSNLFLFSKASHNKMQSFEEFVTYLDSIDIERSDIHIRPQTNLVDLENLDFLGKFETFEVDVHRLLDKIHASKLELPRNNASSRDGNYRSMYNEKTKEIVADLYKVDIKELGYRF